jgi:hypothetical protein
MAVVRLRIIRILGRKYRLYRRKLKGNTAETDLAKGSITVIPGTEAFELKDAVLHECMHAILHQQGYTNEYEAEELYVRPLATGIIALLQDNPELAAWLIQPIERK